MEHIWGTYRGSPGSLTPSLRRGTFFDFRIHRGISASLHRILARSVTQNCMSRKKPGKKTFRNGIYMPLLFDDGHVEIPWVLGVLSWWKSTATAVFQATCWQQNGENGAFVQSAVEKKTGISWIIQKKPYRIHGTGISTKHFSSILFKWRYETP